MDTKTGLIFDSDRWVSDLPVISEKYKRAQPFPHICLQPFLRLDMAKAIAAEFPRKDDSVWNYHKHYNCWKLAS